MTCQIAFDLNRDNASTIDRDVKVRAVPREGEGGIPGQVWQAAPQ